MATNYGRIAAQRRVGEGEEPQTQRTEHQTRTPPASADRVSRQVGMTDRNLQSLVPTKAELLDYWRQQLADPPLMEIPSDHPRPPISSFMRDRQDALIPEDVLARLDALFEL